jgi:Ca2+-binding RTX toxin-like protein
MTTTAPNLLSLSLATVKDTLHKFATQSDYLEQLQIAFGDKFDANIALGIASSIKAGDWSFLPSIEIHTDTELAGNNGAFDTVDNRILVNDKFLLLNSSQPERIVNLLLEEIGHKFDVLLNAQVDSAGDEGAIFAAISQGKALSAPELAQLKATDDHTTLTIDGKQVAVELETWTASDPNGESHTGTADNDTLTGGAGNDTINGGAGSDLIDGGAGNDLINGGEGNNVLKGGTGKDTLIGGSGNDYFNFRNDGTDVCTDGDVFIGGGGNDTVFLKTGADGSKIVYTDINAGGTISGGGSIQGIPNIIFTGGSGDDFVNASGSSNANLTGGDGNDYLIGGAGNDKLFGGAGNDRIEGGSGTNTLTGGTGDDNYGVTSATDIVVENPGEGTDTVWTNQSYTLVDNVENMFVVGNNLTNSGNSADNYIASYGAGNTISTLDGNDTLVGGVGIDTLIGGGGNDIYTVHNSAAVIQENPGEGTDTVWSDATSYTLSANVENINLVGSVTGTGNDGNNTIIAYGAGDKTMNGGGGDDVLIGGIGNDILNGGDGNDILDGGVGVNTLIGGAGDDNYGVHNTSDIIVENADGGNDTVWSDAASYTLSANVENLALIGSVNGTGNDGDNQIIGYGAGDNIISGGKGNDYLAGGAGNDTYVINADKDFGTKTIVETADAGKDTISFAGSSTAINIDLSLTTAQAVTDKIQLVLPLVNLENVVGGAGNDTIAGNSLNNTLTGGAGADKFVFSGGVVSASTAVSLLFGIDTIADFTTGADKLVLSQSTFSAISSTAGAIANFANVANDSLVEGSAAAIVYSQASGKLFYNQNAGMTGFGDGGGQFATLSGLPTLAASDFQIV